MQAARESTQPLPATNNRRTDYRLNNLKDKLDIVLSLISGGNS